MAKDDNRYLAQQPRFWDERLAAVPDEYRQLPVSGKTRDVCDFLLSVGARSVLDIGCGLGRWTLHFARFGLAATGVDIAPGAIDRARAWAGTEGLAAEFAVASAESLPFTTGAFDAVVASAVIDHLPLAQAQQAMAEIKRVLRPGGALFVSFDGDDPEPGPHETLADGTWVFTAGDEAGMVWRPHTDAEARQLLTEFEILDWQVLATGDRWVFASYRPGHGATGRAATC